MRTGLNFRFACLAILIAALPLGAGCSQKKTKPDQDVYSATIPNQGAGTTPSDLVSSDQGNAFGLQTIHFGYDSELLDDQSKSLLKSNAQILSKNPIIRVQIEGHCDQRGGIQYNIALGEKRANAVKHYLEDLGVRPARIATISYGKERPIDTAETEEAYAKNRRANFAVTKGIM